MTWTRALVYVAVWAVLSAYYLVVEYEPSPVADSREATTMPQAQFLPVTAANVVAVELRTRDFHASFVRSGDRWHVAKPAGGQVPADLIAAILASLTEPSEVEVVSATDQRSADFGLAEPVTHLTLRQANGSAVRLLLGARNPAQTAVYAQREGQREIVLLGLNVQYYVDLVIEALERPSA